MHKRQPTKKPLDTSPQVLFSDMVIGPGRPRSPLNRFWQGLKAFLWSSPPVWHRLVTAGIGIILLGATGFAVLVLLRESSPLSVATEESPDGTLKIDIDGDGEPDTTIGGDQPANDSEPGDVSGGSGGSSGSGNGSGSSGSGGSSGSSGGSGGGGIPSGWPGPSNTGVPVGTLLGSYIGCDNDPDPASVITTPGTVIDSKLVNCSLIIRTTGVVINKSKIVGTINTDEDQPGSFSITDSEVTRGMGTKNFTALRVNVYGGWGPNVYCYTNCDIRDSWLHTPSFPPGVPEAHLGAFLANDNGPDGSTTAVALIHNTIHCDTPVAPDGGGCSGDANLFGDFGPIINVLIDNNFLRASNGISYCFYGGDSSAKPFPHASQVVFRNNIFERGVTNQCGAYGPVTSFGTDPTNNPGNVWSNNRYEDGTVIPPVN